MFLSHSSPPDFPNQKGTSATGKLNFQQSVVKFMSQSNTRKVLWIDDEIELLSLHIMYLHDNGYEVTPSSNSKDALQLLKEEQYDAILLDQVMPGQDGMTTLEFIRDIEPTLPVIMVTQMSDEKFVDEVLGRKVDDFLVKPLNGGQIVSTLKRVLDQVKIIEGRLPQSYITDFSAIRAQKQSDPDWREWIDIYVKLTEWDIEFDKLSKTDLEETHLEQKQDSNALFGEYVERYYPRWLRGEDSPMLSVDVMEKVVIPILQQGAQVYFIVLDCLRLDQWLAIEPLLAPYFYINRDYHYTILPSATLYSRNALFSGLFPSEIAERFPQHWQETSSEDETNTNRYEKQFLKLKLENMGLILKPGIRYFKIFDVRGGEEYLRQVSSYDRVSLAAVVVNFIDILTHKRSQLDILQQIAPDEAAFRSLTKSWFIHSSLFEIMKIISQKQATVVLTSDHGSILSNRASKVFGSRDTSTSLRFKVGNNLGCDPTEAIHITEPELYKLSAENSSKNYILAKEDYYFVYPNQFHEYKRQFRGGFQHGGISMEEMIVPLVTMTPKN